MSNAIPAWVPLDHPARAVLAKSAGTHCGRFFCCLLQPDECSSYVPLWEAILRTRLIGIGEFGGGYMLLFLASDGRCFSEDIVAGDVFYYDADSLAHFQSMKPDQRSRPMLRPDQDSVVSWGETFTRDSPEVYDPVQPL